jgi:hypothetical protein
MDDSEKAQNILETLRAVEHEPAQIALPSLNGLVGLIQGASETSLEVEEARANTFMAICGVAKALHRGNSAEQLWLSAIKAAERWRSLALIRPMP